MTVTVTVCDTMLNAYSNRVKKTRLIVASFVLCVRVCVHGKRVVFCLLSINKGLISICDLSNLSCNAIVTLAEIPSIPSPHKHLIKGKNGAS